MLEHGDRDDVPVTLGTALGLLWGAAFEKEEEELFPKIELKNSLNPIMYLFLLLFTKVYMACKVTDFAIDNVKLH